MILKQSANIIKRLEKSIMPTNLLPKDYAGRYIIRYMQIAFLCFIPANRKSYGLEKKGLKNLSVSAPVKME
jgi:hypothetical protein